MKNILCLKPTIFSRKLNIMMKILTVKMNAQKNRFFTKIKDEHVNYHFSVTKGLSITVIIELICK